MVRRSKHAAIHIAMCEVMSVNLTTNCVGIEGLPVTGAGSLHRYPEKPPLQVSLPRPCNPRP